MISIILTLILYASGVTADNCKNYARKAEYNVFKIKAECGTKKCISPASRSRIKAYNDDLNKCNKNIKSLRCKQKRIDLPATPRTCTKCDDLETKANVIVGQVKFAIYRKKCVTRNDLVKVQTYEKSFETCRREFLKLRCKQKISKFPSVPHICARALAPTSHPTNIPTPAPTSVPTPPTTDAPTMSPTSSPTEPPTQPPTSSPTESPTLVQPPPPADTCSTGGNPCTNLQICAGGKCVSTAVTFYQDIVADQVGNVTVAQVGDGPVLITPARCVCYELEADNGYSGLSFNFEPNQLATYTGAGCTDIVHTPHVIGVNNTCYNGTIGDPTVVSTDLYCDDFYIGESSSDFYNINDNLLSMEVCDNLLSIPPPLPPTSAPTSAPTSVPTNIPISAPTSLPTSPTTNAPALSPTDAPTIAPTNVPMSSPTSVPTSAPAQTPSYPVGSSPQSVKAGDLNGDSKVDIVTANSDGTVSILLGNGNGSFGDYMSYQTGSNPFFVLVADFNSDGVPDLATADNSGGTVSILLGIGNGTFGAAASYTTGSGPFALTVADFNRDGKVDIAVANNGDSTVGVLLGNSDGTFGAAASYTAGSGETMITHADFNNDTIVDLAVSNGGGGTVSILLGKGDGTFSATASYPTGAGPYYVETADFNGDKVIDLATANSNDNTVSILLGSGNGTFGLPVSYLAGINTYSVVAADFSGDGILDLVTANKNDNTVSILIGNSNNAFNVFANCLTGTNPVEVVKADFNGDGVLDLVTANEGDGTVSVLLGKGDGTFNASCTITPLTHPPIDNVPIPPSSPANSVLSAPTPTQGSLLVGIGSLNEYLYGDINQVTSSVTQIEASHFYTAYAPDTITYTTSNNTQLNVTRVNGSFVLEFSYASALHSVLSYPSPQPTTLSCSGFPFGFTLEYSNGSSFTDNVSASVVGPVANYILPFDHEDGSTYSYTASYCQPSDDIQVCEAVLNDRYAFCTNMAWWSIPGINETVSCGGFSLESCNSVVDQSMNKDLSQCKTWEQYFGSGSQLDITNGCKTIISNYTQATGRKLHGAIGIGIIGTGVAIFGAPEVAAAGIVIGSAALLLGIPIGPITKPAAPGDRPAKPDWQPPTPDPQPGSSPGGKGETIGRGDRPVTWRYSLDDPDQFPPTPAPTPSNECSNSACGRIITFPADDPALLCPAFCNSLTEEQCCPGCPSSNPIADTGCKVCLTSAKAACALGCSC